MSSIDVRNKSAEYTNLVLDKLDDINEWQLWFGGNWSMSLYISFAYVVIIFSLKSYMRERKPFELRKLLVLWNTCLAVFSVAGTLGIVAHLYAMNSYKDFWYKTICTREHNTPPMDNLQIMFALSKILELGDTIFIVLRKKPLSFLHWYHHVTVLCTCWVMASTEDSVKFWMWRVNFIIHSFMYTYYTLKALHIRIPRSVSMSLTSLQILQMVVVIGCCSVVVFEKFQGDRPCDTKLEHNNVCLIIAVSYLLLFMNYFQKAYFGKKNLKTN